MDIIKKADLNPRYFEEVKDLKSICHSWQDFNKRYLFS
jgi:hypothetical protein